MEAERHPEYPIEKTHLSETQQAIDDYIAANLEHKQAGGADAETDARVKAHLDQRLATHREAKPSPYFGRIDFQEDGQAPRTLYFGMQALDLGTYEVYDVRAPIGRLMSRQAGGRVSYPAPGGQVSGDVELIRHLAIEQGTLQKIDDVFDNRADVPQAVIDPDDYLRRILESPGQTHLRNFVNSIRQRQDELARLPADGVLVINGVAGSGKTSIGYFRLSYLLYPADHARFNAERMIIFGPNHDFLQFTAHLLPELAKKNIRQTTFADWALEYMGLNEKYAICDTVNSIVLDAAIDREIRVQEFKRANLKGSRKMQQLLDRYIEHRRNIFDMPPEGLTLEGPRGISVTFSVEEVKQMYTDTRHYHASVASDRRQLHGRLLTQAKQKYRELSGNQAIEWDETLEADAHRTLSKQVGRILNSCWPRLDAVSDYYDLCKDEQLLKQLNDPALTDADVLTKEEMSLLPLTKYAPLMIEAEDVAAILYLYHNYQGFKSAKFDHILIDEGQDFSYLQYAILKKHSRDCSMTILGDMAQSIYSYRGIRKWSELEPLMADCGFKVESINTTYRSTQQIMKLANEILKNARGDQTVLAEPFQRDGARPGFTKAQTEEEMYQTAARRARELAESGAGFASIALIFKSERIKEQALETLRQLLPDHPISVSIETEAPTGQIYAYAIAEAKGLEFDAVILIGTDAQTYCDTELDGQLLYVGVTRALHSLDLMWVGQPSAHLKNAIA